MKVHRLISELQRFKPEDTVEIFLEEENQEFYFYPLSLARFNDRKIHIIVTEGEIDE